jgi:hypothetical protein
MGARFANGRRGAQRLGGLLFAVAVAAVALVVPGAALAAADLSVTYPATPVQVHPGALATFQLRIGNVGHTPLTVIVSPRKVLLSENGATSFATTPDPMFAGDIHIVPARLALKGRQEKVVTVSVRMPAQLPANDYFLGFLVSPVVTSPAVRAINDVGALVVLDVPGVRAPRLAAWFVHLPHIVLGSSVKGQVRAKSTGISTLQFTTDTLISGVVAPRPRVIMEPPHLLPPGLYWDVPVAWSSWLGLGWYTVHSTLVYNLTAQRTGEVALSRTVIVIDPLWLVAVAAVIAATLLVVRRRRRKRRIVSA